MASFDAFGNDGDDLRSNSGHPFDDDGYLSYDHRVPSQSYDTSSFSNFNLNEGVVESDLPPVTTDISGDEYVAIDNHPPDNDHTQFPPASYGFTSSPMSEYRRSSFESAIPESNGHGLPYDTASDSAGIFSSDAPVLPPHSVLHQEEGFALREWRRENAMKLEEKEKREKEMREQILREAEDYKKSFYEKQKLNRVNKMTDNRDQEKVSIGNREKFHKEANGQYWKAIAELIPREVPLMEKRRGKKESEKPSITVIQGPKPGKPTDLSRMRHILMKLKQNPPPQMSPPPPPPPQQASQSTSKPASNDKVTSVLPEHPPPVTLPLATASVDA